MTILKSKTKLEVEVGQVHIQVVLTGCKGNVFYTTLSIWELHHLKDPMKLALMTRKDENCLESLCSRFVSNLKRSKESGNGYLDPCKVLEYLESRINQAHANSTAINNESVYVRISKGQNIHIRLLLLI